MSNTNLATRCGAAFMAAALGGCAVLGDRAVGLERQGVTVSPDVTNQPVVLNPCEREGIKARPATYVTHAEVAQRTRAGEVNYFYNGYYLFAKKSLVEQWAPLVGAVVVGGLTNGIGTAGVRVAATVAGAGAGGWAGEKLSDQAILERMAKEKGCEQWIDRNGSAPVRRFISDVPDNRPVNTAPRGLELRGYVVEPGPYSETSPGGRRVPRAFGQ